MPCTVPVFNSLACMGSTDWHPLKYSLMWEPFAFSNVTPCLSRQRLNSFEFTKPILNSCVVFVKLRATRRWRHYSHLHATPTLNALPIVSL